MISFDFFKVCCNFVDNLLLIIVGFDVWDIVVFRWFILILSLFFLRMFVIREGYFILVLKGIYVCLYFLFFEM